MDLSKQNLHKDANPDLLTNKIPGVISLATNKQPVQQNSTLLNYDIYEKMAIKIAELILQNDTSDNSIKLKTINNTLIPYIDNVFVYNDIDNQNGLNVMCNHILNISKAFPISKISVSQIKEAPTKTKIIIITSGVMKYTWLNIPATNKQENLALIYDMYISNLSNILNLKISKIDFRSELLSNDCMNKIKGLEILQSSILTYSNQTNPKNLVHSDKIPKQNKKINSIENKSILQIHNNLKEINKQINNLNIKQKINKPDKQDKQDKQDKHNKQNIDDVVENASIKYKLIKPQSTSNLLLFGANKNVNKQINKYEYEIKQAQKNNKSSSESLKNNIESYKSPYQVVNKSNKIQNKPDTVSLELKNINPDLTIGNFKKMNSNEFEKLYQKLKNKFPDEINKYSTAELNYRFGKKLTTIANSKQDSSNNSDSTPDTTNLTDDDLKNKPMIGGYYYKQLPIARKPQLKKELNGNIVILNPKKLNTYNGYNPHLPNHGKIHSETYSVIKNNAVLTITETLLNNDKSAIMEALDIDDSLATPVYNHFDSHFNNHIREIIKKNIKENLKTLDSNLPFPNDKYNKSHKNIHKYIMYENKPIKYNICQKGGSANIVGQFGSIMFPGSTVSSIIPFLLTIGAIFLQKINDDMQNTKYFSKVKNDKQITKTKNNKYFKPLTIKQIKKLIK